MRALSVFDKHQLLIAKKTLRMSDSGAKIMGGMTKEEAREIIRKLTGKTPRESVEIEDKIDEYLGEMVAMNKSERDINLAKDREKANEIGYKVQILYKHCGGCYYFEPMSKEWHPHQDGVCGNPKNDKMIGGTGDKYYLWVDKDGVCPRFQAENK